MQWTNWILLWLFSSLPFLACSLVTSPQLLTCSCLCTGWPACLCLTTWSPQCLLKSSNREASRHSEAAPGAAPTGSSRFLCCASAADEGLSWRSPSASLRWDELTGSPGVAVGGREREKARESTLGRANPDFRICCSALLSLTEGCNSHRMQDFDWAAHTAAVFWPELEAQLFSSCCWALFFFLLEWNKE